MGEARQQHAPVLSHRAELNRQAFYDLTPLFLPMLSFRSALLLLLTGLASGAAPALADPLAKPVCLDPHRLTTLSSVLPAADHQATAAVISALPPSTAASPSPSLIQGVGGVIVSQAPFVSGSPACTYPVIRGLW